MKILKSNKNQEFSILQDLHPGLIIISYNDLTEEKKQ